MLTSMVKRVDTATSSVAKDVVNNSFKGGNVAELGLKEDGVGIAETSSKNTPKDVLDLVAKYSDAIKAGKITVPSTIADAKKFVAPTDIK